MPDRADGKNEISTQASLAARVAGQAAEFTPRADLTYRTFEGLRLENRSVEQSLLTGSLLRSCTFTSVGFQRCDLDGLRIDGCDFVGCSFDNIDFRACTVSRSRFKDCNFDGALIADCSFAETSFDSSSLPVALSDCLFTKSRLKSCDLTRSSFLQSRFDETAIEDMTLGDCTFLYNIMKGCSFRNVRINAESLGMVYGLTPEDLPGMGAVYLGQEQPFVLSENIDSLLQTYEQRRWNLGVAVMRLNFGLTSRAFAFAQYLRSLQRGGLVKRDELTFFARVLEDQERERLLPLMSCLNAVETLTSLSEGPHADASDDPKRAELLGLLVSRLMTTLGRMLDRFEEARLPVEDFHRDRQAELTLTYRHRPDILCADLMSEVAQVSGLPIEGPSTTLEMRDGSFIEIVRTTLLSAAALQAFLYLINGSVVQITELRARLAVLAGERLPVKYRESALQPAQRLPPGLVGPLSKLLTHAGDLSWISDPNLKGYSPGNVVEGELDHVAKSGGSKRLSGQKESSRRRSRAPRK